MKVVLITTGQPSVNPRIVKEADALSAAGIDTTVLFCFWIQWANNADKTLLKGVKWKHHLVGGSPQRSKGLYFTTRLRFKINQFLNQKFGNRGLFAERAQARCYDELLQMAISIKGDWYIGHNLGSLPVAVKAALIRKARSGFDFEDYHREENLNLPSFIQQRIVYLEQKYVPKLFYVSTASPLITKRVHANFPSLNIPLITILNCFPLIAADNSQVKAGTELRLVWFSQTVGTNRGLEAVILALKKINNPAVQLTLAGRCDPAIIHFIKSRAVEIEPCIHFAGTIEPDSLPAFAAGFDVGLATERTVPVNRDICLTNKIFTYLVAGNCILASNTSAQKAFLKEYPDIGLLYDHDSVDDLAEKIKQLMNDRELLSRYRHGARTLAEDRMNWEIESKQLVKLIADEY